MIQCNRLDKGFFLFEKEFKEAVMRVLESGFYILGPELSAFEREFAEFLGVKHCVGVGNGLSALEIALHLLDIGPGDEVLVPSNTYIATVLAVTANQAVPVFVEPDLYFGMDPKDMRRKITKKTKAVIPVHLYGQPADMLNIMEIAQEYGLKVVEDCAQSHGAAYLGKMTGTFGDIGCFSFYPTKNMGAFGDGGAIVTNYDFLADKARIYRNYGSEKKYYNRERGTNSRLDEIQAAVLRVRLKYLKRTNKERGDICRQYSRYITNPYIAIPQIRPHAEPTWHQYVIRTKERDRLARYLLGKGIETMIHYPIPPHLQQAYEYLKIRRGSLPIAEEYADTVLSLPLYTGMEKEEAAQVINSLNQFIP